MEVHQQAISIIKTLKKAGFQAFFAGGWVRDHVMGNDSSDIDIATNAKPQEIIDLFPHTILVGLAFGVVVVVIKGHQFEVATFRKDLEYINGRKPEKVEFCLAEEDARRRDFTINGMFYDPIEHQIFDYVGGMEDIKKRVVRTIGDPYERFREDRLRMVRAFRFSARFGFIVHPDTEEAIRANALTLFPPVAMERVWHELLKMAEKPRFDRALIEMQRLELLPVIFPALEGVHLNEIKERTAVFALFPKNCPAILYIVQLFPDATAEELKDLCLYLKTSRRIVNLAECYAKTRNLVDQERSAQGFFSDIEWVKLFADPDSSLCLEVVAATMSQEGREIFLQIHRERQKRLSKHIQRARERKPLISGQRLQQEGIAQGKKMGALIEEAERLAIVHDLDNPDALLPLLKDTALWELS